MPFCSDNRVETVSPGFKVRVCKASLSPLGIQCVFCIQQQLGEHRENTHPHFHVSVWLEAVMEQRHQLVQKLPNNWTYKHRNVLTVFMIIYYVENREEVTSDTFFNHTEFTSVLSDEAFQLI